MFLNGSSLVFESQCRLYESTARSLCQQGNCLVSRVTRPFLGVNFVAAIPHSCILYSSGVSAPTRGMLCFGKRQRGVRSSFAHQ